jgi:hypothetical protein
MSDTSEKAVKPTIEAERVPDFPLLANEFRADEDFAVYQDLTQRGDKALRRKLFMAGPFVRTAREYRSVFKNACKPLGIKGDNIEGMAIRFLFGPTLDKHAVHDWSCVVKYWRECEPDQQDVEAAAERKLSDLKTAWRVFKQAETNNAQPPHAGAEATASVEPPPLWDFVADALTDVEPALVIAAPKTGKAADQTVAVYLCRCFRNGDQEFYRVGLSEKGLRQIVLLVEQHLPTERAVLVRTDEGWPAPKPRAVIRATGSTEPSVETTAHPARDGKVHCPECGKAVALTAKGNCRAHNHAVPAGIFYHCPGTGRPPAINLEYAAA